MIASEKYFSTITLFSIGFFNHKAIASHFIIKGKKKPCAVRLPPHGYETILLCEIQIGGVASRKRQVAYGKGKKGGQQMNATHQIKSVKFSEPIIVLNDIFDDAEAWGSLKGD